MTRVAALAAGLSLAFLAAPASADRIRNPVAVFAGLDKITGRIISFEVAIDETVQFGALQLTPRVCWSRPATEAPQTTSFVEVDEVTLNSEFRRIFSGWMYAASPGLHGVEHAVYDVWLTDCKGGTEIIPEPREAAPPPVAVEPPVRRQTPQQARPGVDPNAPAGLSPSGRIDVEPPRGVPVQPQQQPTRRFFPTNPQPSGQDPARN
jgi:hypothetical protein